MNEPTERWQRISGHLVDALAEDPVQAFRESGRTHAVVGDGEVVIVLAVGILARELFDTVRTRNPSAYVQDGTEHVARRRAELDAA